MCIEAHNVLCAIYMQSKLTLIYKKYVSERVLAVIFYYTNKNLEFCN